MVSDGLKRSIEDMEDRALIQTITTNSTVGYVVYVNRTTCICPLKFSFDHG